MRRLSSSMTNTLNDTKRLIKQERELESYEIQTTIKKVSGGKKQVAIKDLTSSKRFSAIGVNDKAAVEQLYRDVMNHYDRDIYV